MRHPTYPAAGLAAVLVASVLTSPAPAAEFGKIELSTVPQLQAYLEDRGYLQENSELDLFHTGLAEPASGISDVYALQYLDPGSCGSAGCTEIVVTRSDDDSYLLYEEWLGTGMEMLDSETEGAHDLLIRTDQGVLTGRFNGTKYLWSPASDKGESGEGVTAQAAPAVPRLGQKTIRAGGADGLVETMGECVDDRVWHGYSEGTDPGGGAMGFGPCRTNKSSNFLLFSCKPGAPDVTIDVNLASRDLDDSDPVTVTVSLGGSNFQFKGTALYDVMVGEVLPELEPITLDHPIFEALRTADGTGSISINGQTTRMTLSGAAGAAGMMRKACAAPLAAPDSQP
ncbi:hypothetical protein E2A64_10925 [Pseudohoeflea suaedae]|uniref:Lipoprotein n=1 Tax=Pseudohoeflea suaedae TaxID=877384 RepID=A0A4R5PJJ3_9HYPH|nr:hypothetical protein [Pseudohoeflea suaedae]TDH35830.1 hypothetical protein E2A64_10925 [Pseudohoeflea suaedae]